eukprot:scaffold121798_cov35-Attheya_sp.AAC.1
MVSPFICRSRILLIGVSWALTLVLGLSSLRMVENFASGKSGKLGWRVLGRNNIRLPSFAAEKKKWNTDADETDRLAKDKKSMDSMRSEAEVEFAKLHTPWKWVIRKRICDLLESKDIARPPRPVHHRIPNFD